MEPLTAVILGVVIQSELETVVAATHEVSLTPSVAVMLTSIARSITVSLSLPAGLLWSTTSPASRIISASTPLAWCWVRGKVSEGLQGEEGEAAHQDQHLTGLSARY